MKTPSVEIKPWRDMSPDERFLDQFRHFPTLLNRWRGGRARLWDYSVSHSMLRLRIEKLGVHGHLEIACSMIHIHAPTEWNDASIEIEPGPNQTFVISDKTAGVEIVAGTCSVAEFASPFS